MRIALGEARHQFRLDHSPAPAWQAEHATACRANLPNRHRGVNWGTALSLSKLKRFAAAGSVSGGVAGMCERPVFHARDGYARRFSCKLPLRAIFPEDSMRASLTGFAVALLATTALAGLAQAQTSAPCVNDAPNPYTLVNDWAHMNRAWAPTNNVYVDGKDNVWVMDRCVAKGCLGSEESPIWELSSDGKVVKNFGGGMFAFPHTVKPDTSGNIWAIDGDAKEGKGDQVFKFSADGKVLMTLGKAGQGGKGTDVFDRPTGIAFAPN